MKLAGDDSLFKIWDNSTKSDLLNGDNLDLLNEYKTFCADELNKILIAVKINISPKGLWTTDQKISKFLTPKSINGFINCLRFLIENNEIGDIDFYANKLKGIYKLKIDTYSSSHYRKMGEDIYYDYFK